MNDTASAPVAEVASAPVADIVVQRLLGVTDWAVDTGLQLYLYVEWAKWLN